RVLKFACPRSDLFSCLLRASVPLVVQPSPRPVLSASPRLRGSYTQNHYHIPNFHRRFKTPSPKNPVISRTKPNSKFQISHPLGNHDEIKPRQYHLTPEQNPQSPLLHFLQIFLKKKQHPKSRHD